jgi:N-methylhydantoinase B
MPHAVAAGNVETSQRIVDVVYGALAKAVPQLIPAASQGTMNNLTFGSMPGNHHSPQIGETIFAYYETMGGGIGANPESDGGHAMHSHMSNTRNTPIEALEYTYPLRIAEYRIREASGGKGYYSGGDGLIRGIEFLSPVTVTLVTERRKTRPYGLAGGRSGLSGVNRLIRDDQETELPGKVTIELESGDRIIIESPGGGGWGKPIE